MVSMNGVVVVDLVVDVVVMEEGGRETMNQRALHAKVRRALPCRGSEEDWIGGGVVRKKLVK